MFFVCLFVLGFLCINAKNVCLQHRRLPVWRITRKLIGFVFILKALISHSVYINSYTVLWICIESVLISQFQTKKKPKTRLIVNIKAKPIATMCCIQAKRKNNRNLLRVGYLNVEAMFRAAFPLTFGIWQIPERNKE